MGEQPRGAQQREAQQREARQAALPTGIGTGWVQPEEAEDDADDLWLKWPSSELLQVRITSSEPNNYCGHWVPAIGAYRRCTAPRCPFCPLPAAEQRTGRPFASERRWRHLVSVELAGGQQRIWEFSPKMAVRLQVLTSVQVDGLVTRSRPLRGLVLTLGREGRRRNGEVWAELHPDQTGGAATIPPPLDAAGYLSLTWRRAAIKDGKSLLSARQEGPRQEELPSGSAPATDVVDDVL